MADERTPEPGELRFDGATFEQALDGVRLTAQAHRTFAVMRDMHWRTLEDIQRATGDPQASISARLRDFRKPRFGGLTLNRRRRSAEAGTYEYQLQPKDARP